MQIDALQEVLEKLRSKEMPLEKKHGWLPSVSELNHEAILNIILIFNAVGGYRPHILSNLRSQFIQDKEYRS